jgi:hypothetical protein
MVTFCNFNLIVVVWLFHSSLSQGPKELMTEEVEEAESAFAHGRETEVVTVLILDPWDQDGGELGLSLLKAEYGSIGTLRTRNGSRFSLFELHFFLPVDLNK